MTEVIDQTAPTPSETPAAETGTPAPDLATAAQRNALLSAYVAAQSLEPTAVRGWRVEPAVITFEVAGQRVILHLGLVA